MPAKICPRCGAQYENLRSATCPQCFAKLLVIDESTAEELSAARAQVEQTPEFQEAKTQDDERFREQSFGACLSVLGIFFLTLIVVIALISHAAHRRPSHPSIPSVASTALISEASVPVTPLPVAAAGIDDVLPPQVDFYRRVRSDQNLNIPGTLTEIDHAVYQPSQTAALPVNVFAIPTGGSTADQNTFALGMTLAAQAETTKPSRAVTFFVTEHWRYAVLSPSATGNQSEDFQRRLIARFQTQSHIRP